MKDMSETVLLARMTETDNRTFAAAVAAETPRLRAFLRRQISDLAEVEDILQDTFSELVAAYRLMQPIEHLAAWLLRVARNRVIDRFRSRARRGATSEAPVAADGESERVLDEWLAPLADGPEAAYARSVLAEELGAALDELPPEQRDVFVAHELEGQSFRALAAATGVGVNTLLSRKHAAVRHLRRRLQAVYEESQL
jgi:RNA polymerase sigma factor (sigma-70 family)